MKSWYFSRTVWFNVLSIGVLAVDHLAGTNVIPKEAATILIPLLNIGLRFVTTQPITAK